MNNIKRDVLFIIFMTFLLVGCGNEFISTKVLPCTAEPEEKAHESKLDVDLFFFDHPEWENYMLVAELDMRDINFRYDTVIINNQGFPINPRRFPVGNEELKDSVSRTLLIEKIQKRTLSKLMTKEKKIYVELEFHLNKVKEIKKYCFVLKEERMAAPIR